MNSITLFFKGKAKTILFSVAIIIIAILMIFFIRGLMTKEKDAPYGPGVPSTEIIESAPMEPELQLDN